METIIPVEEGPPYAMIPSYMTAFQSSPVRICGRKTTRDTAVYIIRYQWRRPYQCVRLGVFNWVVLLQEAIIPRETAAVVLSS